MGLRPIYIFNSFSAGIDFRRQNLTSADVRFWRLNSFPALKGLGQLAKPGPSNERTIEAANLTGQKLTLTWDWHQLFKYEGKVWKWQQIPRYWGWVGNVIVPRWTCKYDNIIVTCSWSVMMIQTMTSHYWGIVMTGTSILLWIQTATHTHGPRYREYYHNYYYYIIIIYHQNNVMY